MGQASGLGAGVSRWVRSWILLGIGAIVVIALFVLGAQPFAVGIVPPPYDKLAHAVLFGCLFLVLDRALVLPLAWALTIPLLISAADEWHQMFLPGREASIADWLAGLCGVAVAALFRRKRPIS